MLSKIRQKARKNKDRYVVRRGKRTDILNIRNPPYRFIYANLTPIVFRDVTPINAK